MLGSVGYLFLTHIVSNVGGVVGTGPRTDERGFVGLGVIGRLRVAVGAEEMSRPFSTQTLNIGTTRWMAPE